MNQSTCRWIMIVHIKGFKGLMEGIIKRQEDMVGAMETREMTLNHADIVRVMSTNALDEPDLIKIDHVRDIRKHECRRRLLCFNCKKPGYLWCKCDNTLKVKKGHGKARPVNHVQEDK